MIFSDSNCPECLYRRSLAKEGLPTHTPDCSRIDLASARYYLARTNDTIKHERSYRQGFVDAAQRWEGKFRVVCHENNQLRKRLSETVKSKT